MVHRRQQDGGSSTSAASASSVSNTGSSASVTNTGTVTGTITASGSAGTSVHIGITGGPGFNPNATVVSTIPANGDPGEIVFTLPPPASSSYYKVAPGEYVTFGWNFSYLAYTPTSLTVSAACENGNTYPIGPSNGIIPGNAQNVTWYPYGYQTQNPGLPLAQAKYTLQIWGGSGGISQIPTPGYLAPNENLQFALYFPQAYTPLSSGAYLDLVLSHSIHSFSRLAMFGLQWRTRSVQGTSRFYSPLYHPPRRLPLGVHHSSQSLGLVALFHFFRHFIFGYH